MLDRPLPHDPEAERALLGSLLLADLDLNVQPTDFFRPSYQKIARTIIDIRGDGGTPDVITLADRLGKDNALDICGGRTELLDIQGAVPTAANAAKYHGIVKELANRRRRIAAAVAVEVASYDGEPIDPMSVFESTETDSSRTRSIQDVRDTRNATLTKRRAYVHLQIFPGVHFHYGDVFIVAARPSIGKSALAGIIADECGEQRTKTRLYSLEMPAEDWYDRLIQRYTPFCTNKLDEGLSPEEAAFVVGATDMVKAWPIEINDDPTMTARRLATDLRRFARRGGKVAIIDYLGLLVGKERGESRYEAVTEASRLLKVTAREAGLLVVLLAQLSRKPVSESGAMRPPVLSDLRDSGAIEQDADDVLLIHQYDDDDKKIREKLTDMKYVLERDAKYGGGGVISQTEFAKLRRGPRETVYQWWVPADQRFYPIDRT